VKHEEWSKADLMRLARTSGRPLEVQVAEAFLRRKSKWVVIPSTYYRDPETDSVRELDVMVQAQKVGTYRRREKVVATFSAYISCKGFDPTCAPVVYTIPSASVPESFSPAVL